ncbi:hypothetical protein ACTPOE_05625 [Castellaniella sp. WN]
MNPMDKRLSKLERVHGDVEDPITIVYLALEPSHEGPIECKPIGLGANIFRSGHFRTDLPEDLFIEREPGETVDALIDRSEREHPEVFMWAARYEQDEPKTATPSTLVTKE